MTDDFDLPNDVREILAAARLLVEGGAVTEIGGRCDADDLLDLRALLMARYRDWPERRYTLVIEGRSS